MDRYQSEIRDDRGVALIRSACRSDPIVILSPSPDREKSVNTSICALTLGVRRAVATAGGVLAVILRLPFDGFAVNG